MTKYSVEITHSITTTVEVEASNAQAALDQVNKREFPLPPRDEWQGHKDWSYAVYGAKTGRLLLTEE